ncbi:MAG: DNA polymerase I, partial [Treponema sp.]|nr:DNA polymerase I [Treponema sp.]
MPETKPPLYLIDAYALIYRSYFAFLAKPLRNGAGKNVSALFGFARTVVSLINEGAPLAGGRSPEPPPLLAAVFDPRGPTFRHKLYDRYKATRQKTPEELHEQVPLVREFLDALNVASLCAEGYEADDVIATLAVRCKAEGRECYVVSADKDLLQLVGDGVYALRPAKSAKGENVRGAGPAWELVDSAGVREEWGVGPEGILDLLSLCGDAADNVPGVKGIGEKTAAE